jgi:two-component system, NtrC family, sensor histidine kinase PilS
MSMAFEAGNIVKDQSFIISPPELKNWQALQIFSLFRFTLALIFLTLCHFDIGPSFLGQLSPALFLLIVDFYVAGTVICMLGAYFKKPEYDLQVNVPILFDFLALTLLMHLSGGLVSGLGLLLVAIVAAHSLLAPIALAMLGAALSSSLILAEQLYMHLTNPFVSPMYSQAGILGFCIFVTAFIAARLKNRMYHMQRLAYVRGIRLTNSLKLNAQVVAFMQQGVLVLNSDKNIQLINSAALRLLSIGEQQVNHLEDLPLRFQQAFKQWFDDNTDEVFQVSKDSAEIRISGSLLNEDNMITGYIIFIHDIIKEAQKAQHMKLALLGTFAANIAHEIRNPLSSVKHAAQLLNESSELPDNDVQLVNMIKDNCDRMNTVIKNVLSISKKQSHSPQVLDINNFMRDFIEQFNPPGLPKTQINFEALVSQTYISIDPSQLRQMLINLCENGLRYSMRKMNQPKLDIIMKDVPHRNSINIHIRDYGSGIDGRDAKHMFEPFYTTENQGSGLGLYISREICQMNGGDIHYQATDTGADFCIQLPRTQETRYYDSA